MKKKWQWMEQDSEVHEPAVAYCITPVPGLFTCLLLLCDFLSGTDSGGTAKNNKSQLQQRS